MTKPCSTIPFICKNTFSPLNCVPLATLSFELSRHQNKGWLGKISFRISTRYSIFCQKFCKVILFWRHKSWKCKVASGMESNALNLFLRIRGLIEQGLEHLFIISSIVFLSSIKPMSSSSFLRCSIKFTELDSAVLKCLVIISNFQNCWLLRLLIKNPHMMVKTAQTEYFNHLGLVKLGFCALWWSWIAKLLKELNFCPLFLTLYARIKNHFSDLGQAIDEVREYLYRNGFKVPHTLKTKDGNNRFYQSVTSKQWLKNKSKFSLKPLNLMRLLRGSKIHTLVHKSGIQSS